MVVHRAIPEFTKTFNKLGKFCAVIDWKYTPQFRLENEEGWLVIVIFANNRKVRLFTDKFPNLSYIIDLIQTNKLKHNTNESAKFI